MSTRSPVSRKGVSTWIEMKCWRSSKCRCIRRSHEFKTARSEMRKRSSVYKRSLSEMVLVPDQDEVGTLPETWRPPKAHAHRHESLLFRNAYPDKLCHLYPILLKPWGSTVRPTRPIFSFVPIAPLLLHMCMTVYFVWSPSAAVLCETRILVNASVVELQEGE